MSQSQQCNKNRLQQTSCSCEHCCKSSNICNYCQDWSESIDWKASNPPTIRCNKCPNSYHQKCLPFGKTKPNSWHSCPDIDEQCSKYLHFFSLLHRIKNNKQARKYENIIQQQFNQMYPTKKLRIITAHFCGFHYNKWTYFIQDCAEILLEGEAPGIGRIIDIFSTDQNESFLLIQWYWKRSDFISDKNITIEKELLFTDGNAENAIHVIEIGQRINGKVAVMDNFEQYKCAMKQRDTLKREKTERINQNNTNNFEKKCLFDEDLQFDKLFYSNESCDGDISDKYKRTVYETDVNDTNQKRMEIQKEILAQNTNKQIQNTNRKRKRKYAKVVRQTQKIKKRRIESNHNNNNNNKISVMTVAREEYDELMRENDKLKVEMVRLKQYKQEIPLLETSNANYINKLNCCEKNKQISIAEIHKFRQQKNELCKENSTKCANLTMQHKKVQKNYENIIAELERKNKKLFKTLHSKNGTLEFYVKPRDTERNINKNTNKNTNMNTNTRTNINTVGNQYQISPSDSKISGHKQNTNVLINQDMNVIQLREFLNGI